MIASTIPKTMSVKQIAERFGTVITYDYSSHIKQNLCSIRGVESAENGMLCSLCGYGDTAKEAREDYASKLCDKRLVYGAYSDSRVELTARKVKP